MLFRACRRTTPFVFLLLAISSTSFAQDKVTKIDDLVKRFNELGQFNGTILVAENGRVIYKKGFGYANMEWKIPNDVDTKFRLGSLTKQFTSTLILQLVEQGKIKLDGKITDYLPDYRKDTGDRITIHQLLNHTSGIPSYTDQPGFIQSVSRNPYTVAEFVKTYTSGDLQFEPGTKFSYNNSGYFLLGAIIEKLTGKTYAEAVRDNIFVPLGMKNSGYDTPSVLIPKRASGYSKTPAGYANAAYLDMSIPYSAGSLYSTVEDLYLWDQALYGDKLLTAKSKELMFTPGLQDYGYGIGIRDSELGDKTKVKTIEHSGGINGFSTFMMHFVADKHMVVVLDNTGQFRFLRPMIISVANILYDKPYETAKLQVGELVLKVANEKDVQTAIKQYRDLKASGTKDYDFSQGQLPSAAFQLLRSNRAKDAIELFKLNIEMVPQASKTYENLAEAYVATGEKDSAITNYKKSIELDPKNTSAIEALKRLESPAPTGGPKNVDRFVGRYEVAPDFILTITAEGGKLYGQATGQQRFELEPISETKFAIRIVGAEIDFNRDEKGVVTSLVLHQGGRDIPAKRLP